MLMTRATYRQGGASRVLRRPQPADPGRRGRQPPGPGPFEDHPQRQPRQRTSKPRPLRQRSSKPSPRGSGPTGPDDDAPPTVRPGRSGPTRRGRRGPP
ncbi:hypothetical protein AERYTH_14220 [Aeromicrobium erythreum]|uniref:Uncharacterized protein n=1 Tax=Aeromicrobium erythreum TaxID=2041 RepID=A0A0U3TJM5_9ACTN|nr:hypothetical protein AERYTH_14220 [Aeromicrobium erythreum]